MLLSADLGWKTAYPQLPWSRPIYVVISVKEENNQIVSSLKEKKVQVLMPFSKNSKLNHFNGCYAELLMG